MLCIQYDICTFSCFILFLSKMYGTIVNEEKSYCHVSFLTLIITHFYSDFFYFVINLSNPEPFKCIIITFVQHLTGLLQIIFIFITDTMLLLYFAILIKVHKKNVCRKKYRLSPILPNIRVEPTRTHKITLTYNK